MLKDTIVTAPAFSLELISLRSPCFSQHTGATAGAILNVLDCESRDPVLVEICSKDSF